jgi:hypothetical protein
MKSKGKKKEELDDLKKDLARPRTCSSPSFRE